MGEGKKTKKRGVTVQLALSARKVRTALSAELSERGLYPGQDAVLLAIAENDGISLRDLAQRLSVRPPTITKTMTRLAAQDIVERRVSATDARQSFVHLTQKGHGLVSEVRRSQKAIESQALRGMPAKDRKRLRKLLARVERNFSAVAGDDDIAAAVD